VRWFQFSAFCPLFRSHGRTWKLRRAWGWDTGSYGPIETERDPDFSLPPPSALHDMRVEPICRKYLDLRYRLLPYVYSAVRECHDTGLPLMRALWLHYPDDDRAVERDDEYLWGRELLVAPVTEPGATSRALYLPRGLWYDFWTEEQVEGGREIVRPVDLATIPIYVRAGAAIAAGAIKQYAIQESQQSLHLTVYPGADSDGSSFLI
jgi:alpha-glucosidase (family GH31 glycosyl hydrolase)